MLSSFQGMQDSVKRLVSENATTLLTAGGVVGTVATGILAWRGGYTTAEKIWAQQTIMVAEAEAANAVQGTPDKELPVMDIQTKIKLGALQAVPPIIVGAGTITAIIFSHRMSAQKAAAMAALYGLSQNQFEEYKAKVQEKLTGPKAQSIDDELAQDRVNATPGANQVIVVEGKVLCFDAPTGRYFQSSMEDIKRGGDQYQPGDPPPRYRQRHVLLRAAGIATDHLVRGRRLELGQHRGHRVLHHSGVQRSAMSGHQLQVPAATGLHPAILELT